MKIAPVEYSKFFIRRRITLEVGESACALMTVLYFFGIRLRTVIKECNTLLEAETAYDQLCETYQKGGYDSTD
jgi:hypothetical protein